MIVESFGVLDFNPFSNRRTASSVSGTFQRVLIRFALTGPRQIVQDSLRPDDLHDFLSQQSRIQDLQRRIHFVRLRLLQINGLSHRGCGI
jgi:hypothetical protein